MKNKNTTTQPKKHKLIAFILAFVVLLGAGVFYFVLPSMTDEAPPSLSLGTGGLQGFIGTGTYVKFTDTDLERTSDFNNVENRNYGVQHYYAEEDMSFKDIIDSIVSNDIDLKCLVAVYKAEDTNFNTFPKGPYKDTLEVSKNDISSFTVDAGNGFILVCSDDYGTVDMFGADEKPSDFLYYLDDQASGWHLASVPSDSALESAVTDCERRIQSVWVQADDNFFVKVDKNDPKLEDGFYMVWFKLSGAAGTCEAPVSELPICTDGALNGDDSEICQGNLGWVACDSVTEGDVYKTKVCGAGKWDDPVVATCIDGTTRTETIENSLTGEQLLVDQVCSGGDWRIELCSENDLRNLDSELCQSGVWRVCDLEREGYYSTDGTMLCENIKWTVPTVPFTPFVPVPNNGGVSGSLTPAPTANNVDGLIDATIVPSGTVVTNTGSDVFVMQPFIPVGTLVGDLCSNGSLRSDNVEVCDAGFWKTCNDSNLGVVTFNGNLICQGVGGIYQWSSCDDSSLNYTLGGKLCNDMVWQTCDNSLIDTLSKDGKYICDATSVGRDRNLTGLQWKNCSLNSNKDTLSYDSRYLCDSKSNKWKACTTPTPPPSTPNSIGNLDCDVNNLPGSECVPTTPAPIRFLCTENGTWVENTVCSTSNGTPINTNDYSSVCIDGEIVVCNEAQSKLPQKYVDSTHNMECKLSEGTYQWFKVVKNSP